MSDLKAFHDQVRGGDLSGVRSALEQDPSLLNAKNDAGQTAFLLAKYYHRADVAGHLLSLGPELDVYHSAIADLQDVVLSAVDRDPSILEQHNSDGWTVLHLAAFFGNDQLVDRLLEKGARVDIRSTNAMTNTALHAAVAGKSREAVRALLTAEADPNARQHGGWTALHGATQNGDLALVELLLVHGADPTARADNNQSPLDLALMKGHGEIVALLDQLGAKPQ